ncbi:MAG: helix-turn-helix transcriptional regulator [Ginsengibacter sp.]
MQLTNEIFPDHVKVYPIKYAESPGKGISSFNIHINNSFAQEDIHLLVNEIAFFLQEKSKDTVFSFFSSRKKNDSSMVAWQFNCCRLNEFVNDSNMELVVFTYDLDLLGDLSARLYNVLEHDKFFKENFEKTAKLTPREKEIISLLSGGMSSKEIASHTFTSIHTVYTHRKKIHEKLGIKNMRELIKFADIFELAIN